MADNKKTVNADVLAHFDNTENKMILNEAVEKLNYKQKAVVALLTAGYTQKQSEEKLGITRVAVGLLYKKAINELRRSIT